MTRRVVDFLLHDWLDVAALARQPRFAEHGRETFDAVLDTCERVAAECFAPYNRTVDVEEPRERDGRVVQPDCARAAARAFVDTGLLSATLDCDDGGLQLPYVIATAANLFFSRASIGLSGGHLLTQANANLLRAHGTPAQVAAFARPQYAGRWAGTMCLSEPQAGSSLSDVATRALPDGAEHERDPLGARYRLFGSKMWISNGDHELTENIVHLVLAKIPTADGVLPTGTRGLSLFIVPKWRVDAAGALTGLRNDVALAGLNHKLGYRGTPNTLLSFGEGRHAADGAPGAIGYRVGAPGEGLRCMFHMMNEARIAVGLGAVALGCAGFETSLAYARERRQGRPPGPAGKDVAAPAVRIIEHADVKRMLLAQKAYAQGGLALSLYCARLVDEAADAGADTARDAAGLLEILTPIAKSFPSEWCVEANSLAIQVLGGYGYTRDFPVEQYWRDNRLNMIHEGTHGIQGLDLLGRKVVVDEGRLFALLAARIRDTADRAGTVPALAAAAAALRTALAALERTTAAAWRDRDATAALANATPYLTAFGHVVVAWLWLDVARVASRKIESPADGPLATGLMQAARYFFDYELPKVDAWLAVVASRNPTCRDMREEWF